MMRWWAIAGSPSRRVVAVASLAVVVLGGVAVGALVTRSDGHREASVAGVTTTSASTSSTSEGSTVTSSTTTSSTSTTTTTAPATTVAPAPPPTVISTTTTAAPGPPARQIFALQGAPQGLVAMNANGTGAHLLVEGVFRAGDLAPDRSWLVLQQWIETGGDNLVTVNADGSGFRAIATGAWQSAHISPDGTKIAAVELVEAVGPVLVTMQRDGTDRETIHLPDGSTNQVEWSPDGRKLAVTNSSWNSLAVYDLAARTQVVIRPRPGTVYGPEWSPDGSLIAFSDGDDLVVIPATGGDDRILTSGFAEHPQQITWDGSGSLMFSAGSTVYRIGADGSGLVPVVSGYFNPEA